MQGLGALAQQGGKTDLEVWRFGRAKVFVHLSTADTGLAGRVAST
jgi:hypothetical protein